MMVLEELVKTLLKLWDDGVVTVPWTASPHEKEMIPHLMEALKKATRYEMDR